MKLLRRDPRTGRLSMTYRKWSSMIQRCTNAGHPAFKYYGGRGIAVCQEWTDKILGFDSFIRHMGEAPVGHWIDRIDNDKGYEPGNCRWVTPVESAQNRRHRKPIQGSLRQRALKAGLKYHVVYFRIKKLGWSEEEALSVPLRTKGTRTDWLRRNFLESRKSASQAI